MYLVIISISTRALHKENISKRYNNRSIVTLFPLFETTCSFIYITVHNIIIRNSYVISIFYRRAKFTARDQRSLNNYVFWLIHIHARSYIHCKLRETCALGIWAGFQFQRMKFQLALLQTLVMFNSCAFFPYTFRMVELRGIRSRTHTRTRKITRNTCRTIAVTRSKNDTATTHPSLWACCWNRSPGIYTRSALLCTTTSLRLATIP